MKALILRALPLLAAGVMAAGAARAHAQTGPPGLVVLQQSWARTRRPNPALYEDPMRSGAEREVARIEADQKGDSRPRDGYFYTYTAVVRNEGGRKVRRVDWDYVVLDPASGREVGRQRFTSKVSVAPGRTKKLAGRSESPPSQVVTADYSERVVISRVEYGDGSVWEGASP